MIALPTGVDVDKPDTQTLLECRIVELLFKVWIISLQSHYALTYHVTLFI